MIEAIMMGGEAVGVRLGGQEFVSDDESREVIVPRTLLVGFRLSEIPETISLKPVERIEENTIYQDQDYALSHFEAGNAFAEVEDMGRRKYWDGDVGFLNHMNAMRGALRECSEHAGWANEVDFQDDGDYIFLRYLIHVREDLSVEDAIRFVESRIAELEARREVILRRRDDPVTELLDRGTFNAELEFLSGIEAHELAVVMVDIDHFREVNERIGHPEADRVLRAVATHLRDAVRARGGEAFRYGGEEMVALMPRASREHANATGEEFRHTVEANVSAGGMPVTVSCGVALYPDHGATIRAVLTAADRALYRAKTDGRNRVVLAGMAGGETS